MVDFGALGRCVIVLSSGLIVVRAPRYVGACRLLEVPKDCVVEVRASRDWVTLWRQGKRRFDLHFTDEPGERFPSLLRAYGFEVDVVNYRMRTGRRRGRSRARDPAVPDRRVGDTLVGQSITVRRVAKAR